MRTIKLILEYDGSDFVGWQRQPNGLSVQEVVEGALAQLLGDAVSLVSSGRTDAGVHARGMVAHFHTDRGLPLKAFRDGVNRFLPATVAVQGAEEAADDFHARFDARGKWYRYSIYPAPVRSPLLAGRAWWLRSSLNLAAMHQAALAFVGCHDFAAFRTSGCAAQTTLREIFSIEIQPHGRLLLNKGCAACHNGINVGGQGYFPFGVVMKPGADILPPEDKGRYAVTKTASDEYVFKSPSLRNIELTPPYFHSGQVWDLKAGIAVMGTAQLGATLSDREVGDIQIFLLTLNGNLPQVGHPLLPNRTIETPKPALAIRRR